MVTEAVPETNVSPETSSDAVSQETSDDVNASLSDAQASGEGSSDAAENAGGSEDAAPVETDPEARREALQARLDGDGDPLSSAEKEELRRLTQSYNDRQNAERLRREAKQREIQAINKGIADLPGKIAARLNLDINGSAEDKLALRDIQDELRVSLGEMSTAVVNTIETNLRNTLKGVMPESTHSQIDDSSLNDLLQLSWDYQLEMGKKSSDASKQLSKVTKERDDLKAELERLKGGRAASGAASSAGSAVSGGAITKQQALSATPEQVAAWMADPKKEAELAAALKS